MADIPFTQYLMPNGRRSPVTIDRPDDIAAKAQAIIERGYRFECEMLSDYSTVSLTIADDDDDHEIEVVPNGPEVPTAIDRMIERFATKLAVSA
ncbi:MAG TPA: hypothetical protein VGH13_11585 [Xanthobacteraceae bacterium]|jgi:hypothetical protein